MRPPKISPLRRKLRITVMSMPEPISSAGGQTQHLRTASWTSLIVFSGPAIGEPASSAMATGNPANKASSATIPIDAAPDRMAKLSCLATALRNDGRLLHEVHAREFLVQV